MARRGSVAASAGLVVALLACQASADPPKPSASADETSSAEARALFEDGSRLYDIGEYDQAIQRFEKSYTLTGSPALLLNIAQAYRLKGECAQAAMLYRRYLEKLPTSPRRAEVETRIAEMRACESLAKPRATAPSAPPVARPATPAPLAAASSPPERAPDDGVDPWKVVGWSGVGLAAVGLVVTSVTFGMALDRESSLGGVCQGDGGCPPSERDRIDEHARLRTIAIASGVVTGVGMGVALLGFLRARPPASSALAQGRFRAELWLGPGQIGARGAF